jgi:cbb3-type cytochrome oxidase cytochrome c subunit
VAVTDSLGMPDPAHRATDPRPGRDAIVAETLPILLVMPDETVLPMVLAIALGLTLSTGFGLARVVQAQERAVATTGARLFVAQGCYGCHRVGALGTPIGPDLSRVGAKYAESDLVRWLSDPASQKPNAHMPKLELAPEEITALAAFLAAQR